MKKTNLWMFGLALLLACRPTFAADFDLGQVLTQYQTVSQQFGQSIAQAAKALALLLFTIDLAWMVLSKMLKGMDMPEILTAVIMRVMWLGFLLFLMNAQVVTSVIQGFKQLGSDASGLQVFSPGDVFWQGIDLVNLMTTKFADGANIAGIPVPAGLAAAANPLVAITLGLAIIVIVLAYLMMTAQYIAILLQMYFYLACYPIVLAMGATKFGHDMSMKAISAAIVLGVRFLAIYFVMSIAFSMSQLMGTQLASLSLTNLSPMWAVLGMAGLLAFLAMKVPQMASDLLGGTASLSGGDAVAAGAVAGGVVAALAGGAASLAGGAANGVAGAVRAGQAALNQARQSGATGFSGMAGAAAGAVGGAVGEAAMDKIKGLGESTAMGNLANRIDTKTAAMQEAAAAGAPAASIPGAADGGAGGAAPGAAAAGQDAPPEPTRETPPAPSGTVDTSSSNSQPLTERAAGQSSGNASASASAPAPAPVAAPIAESPAPATSAPQTAADAPAASAGSPAPSGATKQPPAPASPVAQAASSLVNELKTADQAQGAAVQIRPPSHD